MSEKGFRVRVKLEKMVREISEKVDELDRLGYRGIVNRVSETYEEFRHKYGDPDESILDPVDGKRFYFTNLVLIAHHFNGYDQLHVIGKQGAGKTTYAMLVLYQVYKVPGYDKFYTSSDPWDGVLEWLFFNPANAVEKLLEVTGMGDLPELSRWDILKMTPAEAKEILKEQVDPTSRAPLVGLDEAGHYLSQYLYWVKGTGTRMVLIVNSMINMIRSLTAGLILTSVEEDVLKCLRRKTWHRGEVWRPYGFKAPWSRIKYGYTRQTLYGKKRGRVRVRVEDDFEPYLVEEFRVDLVPEDVRVKYELIRRVEFKKLLLLYLDLLRKELKAKEEESEEEEVEGIWS